MTELDTASDDDFSTNGSDSSIDDDPGKSVCNDSMENHRDNPEATLL